MAGRVHVTIADDGGNVLRAYVVDEPTEQDDQSLADDILADHQLAFEDVEEAG